MVDYTEPKYRAFYEPLNITHDVIVGSDHLCERLRPIYDYNPATRRWALKKDLKSGEPWWQEPGWREREGDPPPLAFFARLREKSRPLTSDDDDDGDEEIDVVGGAPVAVAPASAPARDPPASAPADSPPEAAPAVAPASKSHIKAALVTGLTEMCKVVGEGALSAIKLVSKAAVPMLAAWLLQKCVGCDDIPAPLLRQMQAHVPGVCSEAPSGESRNETVAD